VFQTGVRQVRVAFATVLGREVPVRAVQRLVDDALATLAEFGAPGDDVAQLLDGPYADPDLRVQLQTRALRRTARRLAARSAYHRERFAAAGVDPARLTPERMREVPVSVRADLAAAPAGLLCGRPFLANPTSGTTAAPLRVWLSRYEMELWPALVALSMVLRGELTPADHLQVCVNPRATATAQVDVELCRLVGARCSVVGLPPPDEALDALRAGRASVLHTYPSYLGALVTAARDRGLGPDDLPLRAVSVGGEVLTAALARAATAAFGLDRVDDLYGATELMPFGGRTCADGHLHPDPNLGFAEVLNLRTGEPVGPGELGSLVVTPYYPYRECQPVFRYDTRDVVRRLTAERPGCALAAVPAVSPVQGKATDLLWTGAGEPVTPRDVAEALDAVPGVRFPVRHAARVVDGRLRVSVDRGCLPPGCAPAEVGAALAARGLDAEVRTGNGPPDGARPLRADGGAAHAGAGALPAAA
jgi:phenylacetate-coenzyme A ligase PaaK-like adenylate-forming protein